MAMSLGVEITALAQRLFILLVGSLYGILACILVLPKILWNPIAYFRVLRRVAPPSCMQDPKYGVHKKFNLKDGRKLHYVANGDSKSRLVLLIHGYPESWWSWRHQLTALAEQYYVVAMSLPGFGESDAAKAAGRYRVKHVAEDVRELIEHFGRQQAVVIGHDWGGAVAWELAYRFPEVVTRLIVLDCPPNQLLKKRIFSSSQFFRSWYFFMDQLPVLPEVISRSNDIQMFEEIMRKEPFGITNRELLSDEDMECQKYYFSKNGFTEPINYYRQAMSTRALADDLYDRLEGRKFRIQPPTLILWGEKDAFAAPSIAYESASLCENAKVVVFANASHWLQQHEPAAVNEAILNFLSEL